MLEDTLGTEDDEELEEEADAEVDKVLFELTDGKLGQAASVEELPVSHLYPIVEVSLTVGDLYRLSRILSKTKSQRIWKGIANNSTVYSAPRDWLVYFTCPHTDFGLHSYSRLVTLCGE